MNSQKIRCRMLILIAFLSFWLSPAVLASCYFSDGGGNPAEVNFTIPQLIVNSDAPPGTIIYTAEATSASIAVTCDADGDIYQGYNNGLMPENARKCQTR